MTTFQPGKRHPIQLWPNQAMAFSLEHIPERGNGSKDLKNNPKVL
jgi:hypothetical protein